MTTCLKRRLGAIVATSVSIAAMAFICVGAAKAQRQPAPGASADQSTDSAAARKAELDAAIEAGFNAATLGPAIVELNEQGKLNVPSGYAYIPTAESARMMRAMGNQTDSSFLGIVLPAEQAAWFATLDFRGVGYVQDDEAKDWKPDQLLQSLKDGTEAANRDRLKRGFRPIEVVGWVEPPAYDAQSHRLVWAALVRDKGATEGGAVNYSTYALGREGYFELDMIGSQDVVTAEKDKAKVLLSALEYGPGKRYEDFQPGVDSVATYGLVGLITGAAVAKKLGLFATIGVLLVKFWKLIVIAGVAIAAGAGKFLRRESSSI
jgi:uncharacterized membrane-anchored protein